VWPLAVRGQQLPIVGFLHVAAPGALEGIIAAFRGLEGTGYSEHQNVAIAFAVAIGAKADMPIRIVNVFF